MTLKTLTALLLSLACASAMAASAPDFSISMHEKKNELVLTATPPAGHHINLQAPMSFQLGGSTSKISPSQKKPEQVQFALQTKSASADGLVTLFLCDEKNTYCEKHEVRVTLPSSWVGANTANTITSAADTATHTPAAEPSTHLGFLLNTPEKALEMARSQNKPLLIDFFGIWCPPCNLLDEQVFPSAEFKKASANFILLKLDADKEVSWALKSKYKIAGYPTLIFANAQGEEIDRIVGFLPKEKFTTKMNQVAKSKAQSQAELKALAEKGHIDAQRTLGQIHFERKEYAEAASYFAKSPQLKENLIQATVAQKEAQAQEQNTPQAKAELQATYEEAIKTMPHSSWTMLLRSSYADLMEEIGDKEKQKTALEDLATSATKFLAAKKKGAAVPLDDTSDLSATDLWATIADAQEKLGNNDKAKKAYLEAATLYKKAILQSPQKDSRGYHLELAYCLWKAGLTSQAEQIYERFENHYPEEFTFYFSHSKMFFEQKNFEKSKELSEKAYRYSYGDNKLRVAEVLAKSLKELGKKTEAKIILQNTLQSTALPADASIRTHRYYNKLKTLAAQL